MGLLTAKELEELYGDTYSATLVRELTVARQQATKHAHAYAGRKASSDDYSEAFEEAYRDIWPELEAEAHLEAKAAADLEVQAAGPPCSEEE